MYMYSMYTAGLNAAQAMASRFDTQVRYMHIDI